MIMSDLRAWRTRHRISMERFADAAHVSVETLRHIETGKRPIGNWRQSIEAAMQKLLAEKPPLPASAMARRA
jgi:transcriptional regulator with XRE-family HTH domain